MLQYISVEQPRAYSVMHFVIIWKLFLTKNGVGSRIVTHIMVLGTLSNVTEYLQFSGSLVISLCFLPLNYLLRYHLGKIVNTYIVENFHDIFLEHMIFVVKHIMSPYCGIIRFTGFNYWRYASYMKQRFLQDVANNVNHTYLYL